MYNALLTGPDWVLEEPTIGTVAVRIVWQGSDELGTHFEVGLRGKTKLRVLFDQIDVNSDKIPEMKRRRMNQGKKCGDPAKLNPEPRFVGGRRAI